MGDSRGIVIGLLAAHDDRDLADALAADLPPALREQVGDGTRWATEVRAVDPADATASAPELVAAVASSSSAAGGSSASAWRRCRCGSPAGRSPRTSARRTASGSSASRRSAPSTAATDRLPFRRDSPAHGAGWMVTLLVPFAACRGRCYPSGTRVLTTGRGSVVDGFIAGDWLPLRW